jgi:hypothetical protein
MSLFILWEDNAIGPIARFGPHVFLVACVASRMGVDRYRLMSSETIGGKPCAGNANVLRELQRGPLWDSVARVVTVLDSDAIHDRLPGIASRGAIADAEYDRWSDAVVADVRKRAPDDRQHQLEVCLLDRNLETLLSLLGRGARELDSALGKSRLHRDKILQRAAGDEGLVTRACEEMTSWGELVATVTQRLKNFTP